MASSIPPQPSTLSKFEGHDVVRTSVRVTGAGDGLSQAMTVDPVELHHRQTVVLVIECVVAKVHFEPDNRETDDLQRVHTLKAGTATFVDRAIVAEALELQLRKIEQAKGIERLDLTGAGEPDAIDDALDGIA